MQISRRVDRLTDLNRYFCEERVCQSEKFKHTGEGMSDKSQRVWFKFSYKIGLVSVAL